MMIKHKNMSVQGEHTKIPCIPFRGSTFDFGGFIYQLMGILAMQAKDDGIFLSKLSLIKFFSLCFLIIIRTFLRTNNCTYN